MEDEMTLAQLFEYTMNIDPSFVSEAFFVSRRTEHKNGDGDVYYLFNDGSIYSFIKDQGAYFSLDLMKDCFLDEYGEMLERCKTLDDILKLKFA